MKEKDLDPPEVGAIRVLGGAGDGAVPAETTAWRQRVAARLTEPAREPHQHRWAPVRITRSSTAPPRARLVMTCTEPGCTAEETREVDEHELLDLFGPPRGEP